MIRQHVLAGQRGFHAGVSNHNLRKDRTVSARAHAHPHAGNAAKTIPCAAWRHRQGKIELFPSARAPHAQFPRRSSRRVHIFCPPQNFPNPMFLRTSAGALRCPTHPDRFTPMSDRTELMLSVRIPADLRAALKCAAEREHRTLSQQTRYIIERAVMKPQPEGATA
jgi:hypothetical protein